ncbi:hypothetical protein SLH49_03755 [Cognatiyoonia sp. IB215446]|uniref:hypothetical protein n=1 Tax=Cognatiyoonia sp. IB215446 TaxID=3097355 RepID=UPI002A17FEFB|nr:hypothetical protein [Cognatiyoonia sp. IB215446]MDX8347093.1 hypothetical protein [Cognatiyoonia sp. IB215446]
MAKFEVRLMFEWGGPCLWGMNDAAKSAFGGYAGLENTLPLSEDIKAKLFELIEIHDGALDWANPGGPSLWSKQEFDKFETEARSILEVIQTELDDRFLVWYEPVGKAEER